MILAVLVAVIVVLLNKVIEKLVIWLVSIEKPYTINESIESTLSKIFTIQFLNTLVLPSIAWAQLTRE